MCPAVYIASEGAAADTQVLYCTVLYCAALYCTLLYCADTQAASLGCFNYDGSLDEDMYPVYSNQEGLFLTPDIYRWRHTGPGGH